MTIDLKQLEDAVCSLTNSMAEKYPLGCDFGRHQYDIITIIQAANLFLTQRPDAPVYLDTKCGECGYELTEVIQPAAPPIEVIDTGIGTPMQAIQFVLDMTDHYHAYEFLLAWSEGDTSEWPEYSAFLQQASER